MGICCGILPAPSQHAARCPARPTRRAASGIFLGVCLQKLASAAACACTRPGREETKTRSTSSPHKLQLLHHCSQLPTHSASHSSKHIKYAWVQCIHTRKHAHAHAPTHNSTPGTPGPPIKKNSRTFFTRPEMTCSAAKGGCTCCRSHCSSCKAAVNVWGED